MGLFSTIHTAALNSGDSPAIVSGIDDKAEQMNYRSLYHTVAHCQKSLSGADHGQVVAIVANKSAVMVAAFGEAGRHAREAVGVAELPLGAPVELSVIIALAD